MVIAGYKTGKPFEWTLLTDWPNHSTTTDYIRLRLYMFNLADGMRPDGIRRNRGRKSVNTATTTTDATACRGVWVVAACGSGLRLSWMARKLLWQDPWANKLIPAHFDYSSIYDRRVQNVPLVRYTVIILHVTIRKLFQSVIAYLFPGTL